MGEHVVNFWIFLITVLIYATAWSIVCDPLSDLDCRKFFKRIVILVPLCIPFNINGDVYTVFGNAASPRDIFTAASFYQEAPGKAGTFFNLGYQAAGRDAAAFFSLYQKEDEEVRMFVFWDLVKK